ncbi:ubiquitin carboxyl-terminal hydrolase 42-like isoform 1-T2 [Alca torda]
MRTEVPELEHFLAVPSAGAAVFTESTKKFIQRTIMDRGTDELVQTLSESLCDTLEVIAEGMAPPQRILFPPEKIRMDWQQRQRAGAGLHSLGNTCFLNSVLQCLTHTPPLANYLLSREHSQSCPQEGFCMMCIMEAHVNQVLHSSASAIPPWAVVTVLRWIGDHF